MAEIDFTRQAKFILWAIQIIFVPLLHGNIQCRCSLFFFPSPSIGDFLCKKQDDTAHKGIYSRPLSLQQCIFIFGFLSAFPRVFSPKLKISQGGGIRNAAWWHEVEKGQRICRRWPVFRQLFPARRILELVELLPGTFTS